MVEQDLELMHLMDVELAKELVGVKLVQLTSLNHATHLQVRHIHVLFY